MIEFSAMFEHFQSIQKGVVQAEEKLLNGSAAADQAAIKAMFRMAEHECEDVIALLMRARGIQPAIRKHGQGDAGVSFTVGPEAGSDNIVVSIIDHVAKKTESHLFPPSEYRNLVELLARHVPQPQQS